MQFSKEKISYHSMLIVSYFVFQLQLLLHYEMHLFLSAKHQGVTSSLKNLLNFDVLILIVCLTYENNLPYSLQISF